MSTGRLLKHIFVRLSEAKANASSFWTPARQEDAEALLFSVKCFTAAMLAYRISLGIGLSKPYWAITTVYVVSQTSAAASFSRGVYRLLGTVVGAAASVLIFSVFGNEPIACSIVLACWIGVCFHVSLIDRTPRAYALVLAGYTAGLIGFPIIFDPDTIFDTALVRIQEIAIGVLCAVLVHRFVFPKRMADHVQCKLTSILDAAQRLARDALEGQSRQVIFQDRSRLAADLLALQGLVSHLPYDPGPRGHCSDQGHCSDHLKHILDCIARLLPLSAQIEDELCLLQSGIHSSSQEVVSLVTAVERWIAAEDVVERELAAMQLNHRATSLQCELDQVASTLGDRVAAKIAGHLAELVCILSECDLLMRAIVTGKEQLDRKRSNPLGGKTDFALHRDYFMAARAALGAVIGIVTGSIVWIMSGWSEGGTAVAILAICCVLFGNVDAPAANVVKYMVGAVFGVFASAIYSFFIFPKVMNFAVLVAVLAPAFLFAGSMQARPSSTLAALGVTLTIPILTGLDLAQSPDLLKFSYSVIALFLATGFALISMSLVQTVQGDEVIERLVQLSRQDIGRLAFGIGPPEAHWISLMIDRTALLYPRLGLSKQDYSGSLVDGVRYLRVGRAVGQLYQANLNIGGHFSSEVESLLSTIRSHFSTDGPTTMSGMLSLVGRIDKLIALTSEKSVGGRSRVISLLIDLRLALIFPVS